MILYESCDTHMMQFGPSSLVLDANLSPISEQCDARPWIIPHDGRVVERSEALRITVVGRGTVREKRL